MLLAVEATIKSASIALYDGQSLRALATLNAGYTHSQALLPLIDRTLRESDLSINEIDGFIVANGPGSFTGIRIALATIKGLAQPGNKPIYTASTLRSLAGHGRYFNGIVCPILDARRNQVYTAAYDASGTCLLSERACQLDQLIDDLCTGQLAHQKILFVGDAVALHCKRLSDVLGDRLICAELEYQLSSATGLVYAHQQGWTTQTDYLKLSAHYLRKAQAEREREAKQNEN